MYCRVETGRPTGKPVSDGCAKLEQFSHGGFYQGGENLVILNFLYF